MAKRGNPLSALWQWMSGDSYGATADAPKAEGPLGSSKELQAYIMGGSGNVAATGRAITADTALRLAAFYRGINLLSGVIAGSRIDIRETETMRVLTNHPLNLVLNRRPNGWQSGYDFKRYLMQ